MDGHPAFALVPFRLGAPDCALDRYARADVQRRRLVAAAVAWANGIRAYGYGPLRIGARSGPFVQASDADSILAWLRWNDRNSDYPDDQPLDDVRGWLVAAWCERYL